MKIVFYENQENKIWFKGRRAELVPGKVVFSNSPEWVDKFNSESVENIKEIVKSYLPRREVSRNENNSILLYIPFEMKDQFIQVLEALDFQARDCVPTSGELGLGNEEPRTRFYDGIKIRNVYELEQSEKPEPNGQTYGEETENNTVTSGFNWLKIGWGLAFFITVSAILISFFIFNNDGRIKPNDMGIVINLAGKQRMLTQKMSKEILFIAKDIHVAENQEKLRDTAILFNQTLMGLFEGDSDLKLVKIEDRHIVQQLEKVVDLWREFRVNVDRVLRGNTSIAVLKKVALQNLPLLHEMDMAVMMYEDMAKEMYREDISFFLEPNLARSINSAGRQRMLTQKMTKELLLVAINIEPIINKKRLVRTMSKFERTLAALFDGDDEMELLAIGKIIIHEQLISVKEVWDKYKPILTKSKVSQADLEKAYQLNLELLDEMDKAVKMYENSVK
jgi:hypothetical protein